MYWKELTNYAIAIHTHTQIRSHRRGISLGVCVRVRARTVRFCLPPPTLFGLWPETLSTSAPPLVLERTGNRCPEEREEERVQTADVINRSRIFGRNRLGTLFVDSRSTTFLAIFFFFFSGEEIYFQRSLLLPVHWPRTMGLGSTSWHTLILSDTITYQR